MNIVLENFDEIAAENVKKSWNSVCKPLGSLGLLEEYIAKLAGIYGTTNICIDKRCAVVVCADNGVVCEGVTQTGKEVTLAVAESIAAGIANINIMAKAANTDTFAVDIGIDAFVNNEKIIDMKVGMGTANIKNGPAMSKYQAEQAIQKGIEIVRIMKEKGYSIITTGEMGIGNTTTSSAISSVILNMPVENVTGRGAGLSTKGLRTKIEVIKKAIEVNKPDRNDPLDVLSKLGGYDIAAMTGMFIGGAVYRIPIVIDGYISSVAALLAKMMYEETKNFMFASHVSEEPAGQYIMESLELEPILHGHMRLGEGTGAVCLLPILDIALSEFKNAYRFADTNIEQYEEQK